MTALAAARADMGDGTGICGTIALVGAKSAVEQGLDAEARELLAFGMGTSQVHGFVERYRLRHRCGRQALVG